jgi:hypothetical protein
MGRKKGIILTAFVESLILGLLVVLFCTETISLNLFLILIVLAGILSSTALLLIIKNTEPE